MRVHSRLAAESRQDGQVGIPDGFGSLLFSFRFPGFPASSFCAVGFGLRPTINSYQLHPIIIRLYGDTLFPLQLLAELRVIYVVVRTTVFLD